MPDCSASSLQILTPRGRGRPKAEEPGTSLTIWVSVSQYNQLVRLAQQEEKSLSALGRDLITVRLIRR